MNHHAHKRKASKKGKEYPLHTFTADLLRFFARPKVIWFHVPNGEARSARTGAKLKRMGVRAGVADFTVILPGGLAHFLELKGTGYLSAQQREFRSDCEANGATFREARSPEDVLSILREWGAVGAADNILSFTAKAMERAA